MRLKEKNNGCVEASSPDPISHSNRLVYVKYWDHILFRNSNPQLYGDMNVREAVGWLVIETNNYLCLLNDRSVDPLPSEARESGLILIKSDILEVEEIK